MKLFLAGLLLTLSFLGRAIASQSPSQPIDIIFDIDWTTFYTINPTDPNQADSNIIWVEGKAYRPTEHLGEVLESLLQHPEVRVSFFSGGERSRNEALLKAFRLPSGRSAFDVSYRVFSKEDLSVVSTDATMPFSKRYKKSLEGLLPNATPERAVLIDDQPEFAKAPWVGVSSLGRFNFQKNFDASKIPMSFFPENREQWMAEKDKALMWKTLLEEAISSSEKSETSFAQIVSSVWSAKSQNALCKNLFSF
ncbi:MAG TPA: hypothetical protein VF412_01980 [Bdellovibrio sp.]|uniref:hypothetical protein n=1 Tax=Bdellovibrio sp. TaxID=28201 RepID=UPI002EE711FC